MTIKGVDDDLANEINGRFKFLKMNEEQILFTNNLRYRLRDLSLHVCNNLGESRERSLALSKLEEASFWMNKAVSRNFK